MQHKKSKNPKIQKSKGGVTNLPFLKRRNKYAIELVMHSNESFDFSLSLSFFPPPILPLFSDLESLPLAFFPLYASRHHLPS